MSQSTRDQLLKSAEALFAERGFYGVSIAQIADELGLTKQALLHYFPTKEKLYGEVLNDISHAFETMLDTSKTAESDPAARLRHFVAAMVARTQDDIIRTRLLMRELLDNKRRTDGKSTWYLRPFLEALIEMVQAVPAWSHASEGEALAAIYQLLGAVTYFTVSEPTLRGIFGPQRYQELDASFQPQLLTLVSAILENPPQAGKKARR